MNRRCAPRVDSTRGRTRSRPTGRDCESGTRCQHRRRRDDRVTMRRALLAGMSVLMAISACEDDPAGPNDVSAPRRVTDIAVTRAGADSLYLQWTAPGDDGGYGTATVYEIRRSSAYITDANFDYATIVANPPAPLLPGTTQQ